MPLSAKGAPVGPMWKDVGKLVHLAMVPIEFVNNSNSIYLQATSVGGHMNAHHPLVSLAVNHYSCDPQGSRDTHRVQAVSKYKDVHCARLT